MEAARRDGGLPIYKIVLVGEEGVGKSSLWFRFRTGRCAAETMSTVGIDTARKAWSVPGARHGEQVELQLWDTGGGEARFGAMTKNYYRGAHAILFVFSVDIRNSLPSLSLWLKEVEQYGGEKPLYIFLCNKVDLPDDEHTVYTATIQNFFCTHAEKHGQLSSAFGERLFYTSAVDCSNAGLGDALDRAVLLLHCGGRSPGLTDSFALQETDSGEPAGKTCPTLCRI